MFEFADVLRMVKKGLQGEDFKWECMDACCMSFESSTFDRVVDKGMLDAIMCKYITIPLLLIIHLRWRDWL
jgi:hypothetical protein